MKLKCKNNRPPELNEFLLRPFFPLKNGGSGSPWRGHGSYRLQYRLQIKGEIGVRIVTLGCGGLYYFPNLVPLHGSGSQPWILSNY